MADIVIKSLGPLWELEEVKLHLRVDDDEEGDLIKAYMAAAEQALLRFCNLSLVPCGQEAVFKAAGLITVSAFYDNRLMTGSEDGIPTAARALVWPYRWLPI